MVCERIRTQSPSDESEASLAPSERLRLLAAMVCAGEALRKLRVKKLSHDSHQRTYHHWGHIIRAKVKDFRTSENGKAYYRRYQSERRKKPHWHFRNWLYGDINRNLKRQRATRSGRTEALVGCSIMELMGHLEAQFTNGFSWANRSSWHVDHIVPTSAFNLADPEEQKWAFNYRNLRPMDGKLNQSKSDTLPDPLPGWLPGWLGERVVRRKEAK